ncbi:hypothetical protein PN613_16100 [Parabacteroides distasonis]|jgi:chromosome segregation ATPase|uniref:hypothetical protein n=1 Tax=Parabacteroides distasonis TaxID=823 RepID=UPI00189C398C|nr:hypothetical protein [Parabacteroides distasonis]MDB8998144.1 hypothetical protein [Parabacteroides distasonis]MDB9072751.1 hypothetical protein [Parabacteroides distasonis]
MKTREDYLAEIKYLEEQLAKSKALGEELRNDIARKDMIIGEKKAQKAKLDAELAEVMAKIRKLHFGV